MVLPSALGQEKVEPPAQPLQQNLRPQVLLIDYAICSCIRRQSIMSSLMERLSMDLGTSQFQFCYLTALGPWEKSGFLIHEKEVK